LRFLLNLLAGIPYTYYIDDSRGPARIFEGIGAVSAGGSTALLPMYSEPFRSQVLDLLFMPSFGASLQVLKVEIGSEAQATDGSEAAHQRNPWEKPNFERGYEYWLMTEAKKRNPNCKIYGLPWAWPRFLTCSSGTLSRIALVRTHSRHLNEQLNISLIGFVVQHRMESSLIS
jgi:hypothetical protein